MKSYLEELSQPVDPEKGLNMHQSNFLMEDCGRGQVYRGLVAQYGKEAVAEALGTFIAPQVVRLQLSVLCPEPVDISYNKDKL